MGFWEEFDENGFKRRPQVKAAPVVERRSKHDAPELCLECGHLGTDVFFGSCGACFAAWEEGAP